MHCLIHSAFRDAVILGLMCLALGYVYYLSVCLPPHMEGHSSFPFRPTVHEYRNLIQKSRDLGSSFSVYHKNNNVVDIVGGYMDSRFQLHWSSQTVTQAFTISTIIVPFTMAKLMQEGILSSQDPIQKYISRFSVPNITVGDLLMHKTGFPHFLDPFPLSDWRDNYRIVIHNITNQVPPIRPETSHFHYHSLALLADAIVRRVDNKKRTLSHYFLEEIGWPSGIDIMVGIPRSQLYRAARTYHSNFWDALYAIATLDFGFLWTGLSTSRFMPWNEQRLKALNAFSDFELRYNWNADFMEIPLASMNVFTNARGLTKLLYLLDNPKLPTDEQINTTPSQSNTSSKPLLEIFSPETIAWMLQTDKSSSYDPVLRRYVTFTRSGLMVETSPKGTLMYGMSDDIMGQAAFYDPSHHLSWAYMTNHAHGHTLNRDPIVWSLVRSMYNCL